MLNKKVKSEKFVNTAEMLLLTLLVVALTYPVEDYFSRVVNGDTAVGLIT